MAAQNNLPASPSLSSLDKFIDDLIEAKKFPQMTGEIEAQMKKDLHQRLNDFLNAKLIVHLSDDQAKKLEELLSKNPEIEKVHQFFEDNIPDLVNVIANILSDFKKIYLGTI